MKMESLQQRREELERKEFQLKESLLKFDKFLKVRIELSWGSFFQSVHLQGMFSIATQYVSLKFNPVEFFIDYAS